MLTFHVCANVALAANIVDERCQRCRRAGNAAANAWTTCAADGDAVIRCITATVDHVGDPERGSGETPGG